MFSAYESPAFSKMSFRVFSTGSGFAAAWQSVFHISLGVDFQQALERSSCIFQDKPFWDILYFQWKSSVFNENPWLSRKALRFSRKTLRFSRRVFDLQGTCNDFQCKFSISNENPRFSTKILGFQGNPFDLQGNPLGFEETSPFPRKILYFQ